jgi:hypothetical protein
MSKPRDCARLNPAGMVAGPTKPFEPRTFGP